MVEFVKELCGIVIETQLYWARNFILGIQEYNLGYRPNFCSSNTYEYKKESLFIFIDSKKMNNKVKRLPLWNIFHEKVNVESDKSRV